MYCYYQLLLCVFFFLAHLISIKYIEKLLLYCTIKSSTLFLGTSIIGSTIVLKEERQPKFEN